MSTLKYIYCKYYPLWDMYINYFPAIVDFIFLGLF